MKGCEAIAEAALRAGCRFYAGYPITPQNEIPEYMSRKMPELGGAFVQGESEIASINMVYGASAAGTLAMTSSSSPGISLKSEGMSYLATARLPAVIVSVMRGGPGVGSIQPAQQDYLQAAKASGNGGFRTIALAPATLQEAVDLTYKAFELAQRDRNPVIVLPDGLIGAIMEPVTLPPYKKVPERADWCATGCGEREEVSLVMGGSVTAEDQYAKNVEAAKVYELWEKNDVMVEEYLVEDAQYVIAAYGSAGRICKTCVDQLREEGVRVGLIRPITVNPFPYEAFRRLDPRQVRFVLDVEMSIPAQMLFDVRLGVRDLIPVETTLTSGGILLKGSEVVKKIMSLRQEGNNGKNL